MAVRGLRELYPRWGKDKLVVLLGKEGFSTSGSTVGRIIRHLKATGGLVEPKGGGIWSSKRRVKRPYAVRKPKGYDAHQVDTLDIRPAPGVILKQFTARDFVSKWDVIEVRSRATSHTAKEFLDTLGDRMPFRVRAIQVDGGSEFFCEFEQECQSRGIKLFVLPPKSPKLNGSVERAQRTHTEELYEVHNCPWTVGEVNKELLHWEWTYNCIRPHQALGYRTPLQFLKTKGIIRIRYPSNLPSHIS